MSGYALNVSLAVLVVVVCVVLAAIGMSGCAETGEEKKGAKTILIVLNRAPYDGTDVAWNALRLVGKLKDDGTNVRLFLMNDSVDLARESTKAPEDYFDLVEDVKKLIAKDVPVKACGTCQTRCGIHKGEGYYEGAEKGTLGDLSEWVRESDQVITF